MPNNIVSGFGDHNVDTFLNTIVAEASMFLSIAKYIITHKYLQSIAFTEPMEK